MNRRIMERMARLLMLLLLVLPVLAPVQAQERTAADKLAGLDEYINARLKEWKVPGLAIAVVQGDKVVYAQGFGLRDVAAQKPVTAATLFAIGSTSKAFTATGLGMLVAENKFEWDTPVVNLLPGFQLYDPYATAHMTPRDLVTHRSGLPRHDLMWYGSPHSRRELFTRLRHLPASRGFRSTYQYQNLMFMTAGILIEQTSGQSWEDFTRGRFFARLEMPTSNFSVNDSQRTADFALPYVEREGNVTAVPFRNIDAIGPAGSINSSVTEMANWVIANINEGKFKGQQVIPAAALRAAHAPQMIMPGGMQFDEISYGTYGMGWAIHTYRGNLRLSHGGGIDGFSALVSLLPRAKFGVVILTNLGGTPLPGLVANEVYDRLLGLPAIDWNARQKEATERGRRNAERQRAEAEKDRKNGTKPSLDLAGYAGKFEHPGYGTITIENSGGALKIAFNSFQAALRHYHYDIFEVEEAPGVPLARRKVQFVMNDRGEVARIEVKIETAMDALPFTRVRERTATAGN